MEMTEPTIEPQPEPDRPPVSRAALAIAVAVLVVGAALAVIYVAPRSNTPEDAVRELAAAVSDEDVIGVLDALAPSERRLVKDFVVDVAAELERLQVFDDALDLRGVAGVDVEIEDLDLASRSMAEGIALVSVRGGTIRYQIDPAELPAGPVIDRETARGGVPPRQEGVEPIEEFSLMAVEESGEWHVSLFYSLAEAIRQSAGAPVPDFGSGPDPEGHPSPDAAVRAAVDAVAALDVRRVVALLPPDEGKVVRDYSSLLLDRWEEAAARTGVELSVDSIELDTELEGDGLAVVHIRRLAASFRSEDGAGSVRWDGKCLVTTDGEGESFDSCDRDPDLAVPALPFTPELGLVVVERDGEWYVSPVRSVLRPILAALRAMDHGDLEDIAGALFGGGFTAVAGAETVMPGEHLLRNALTAAKVAYVDAGSWPEDPAVLGAIEPSVSFQAADGVLEPFVVDVEVQGTRLFLATRDADRRCLYLAADGDGAVAYAKDEACGPAPAQAYAPDGWED